MEGPKSADIVVYDAEPRGDCQGFGFEAGKDYLVFVRERAVTPDSEATSFRISERHPASRQEDTLW